METSEMVQISVMKRTLFLLALLLAGARPAAANDLPIMGNRAAEEVLQIERGTFAVGKTDKARMHVFSIISNKMVWDRNTLDVCFWNGSTTRQADVAKIADELTTNLPVKFKWRDAGGAFNSCPDFGKADGVWNNYQVRVSLVPNDALLIKGDNSAAFFAMVGRERPNGRQATVNLPFKDADTTQTVRNSVLHEFCHVLGCLHEFQRDICTRDLIKPVVMKAFGLNDAQYRANFNAIPSGHAFSISGTFDRKSVMVYLLKPEWFSKLSECSVGSAATKLSPADETGLEQAYALTSLAFTLDDFDVRAATARADARSQRLLASSLKATNTRWQTGIKGLDPSNFASQSQMLDNLIRDAEQKASTADAEVEQWTLTSREKRAVRRALSYFPD
jgi:hypothetical protein